MLHHVEPGPLDPPPLHANSYLTRDDFARLLDDLAARRMRTLTLAEAGSGTPGPPRAGRGGRPPARGPRPSQGHRGSRLGAGSFSPSMMVAAVSATTPCRSW